jgi:hypothetical protein
MACREPQSKTFVPGPVTMKTNLIAALAMVLMASAPASAQQATADQLIGPHQCGNGVTITVIRCRRQAGAESCEFKAERSGVPPFQGADLRERVAEVVKACSKEGSASAAKPAQSANGKSFNPPYLSEMPSADRVIEAMKTNDPRETAVRQIWAFYELTEIIKTLSKDREFERTGMLPDEEKINKDYLVAQYKVSQAADKAYPANKPSEDLTYHFSRWDPKFGFKGINIWQFFSEGLQSEFAQIVAKDNARYAAKRAEEKRIAEEALKANAQETQAPGGQSPFIRNDPGTLAARRCVELGGSEAECVGKGLWSGLMDLAGVPADAMKGTVRPATYGVFMNGQYNSGSDLFLRFGPGQVSINGCGKLVPNSHGYTITKKPNQLLINVKSEPNPFVLSLGNDGKLSGPGPVDVKGEIITGYRNVWMQEYRNGAIVAGGGYWTQEPIYAPKTERCAIGTLAQAPPPPPEKSPLIKGLTTALNSFMPEGPTGLRMTGQYVSQGGLALEFAADSVILDCAAAHVKQSYTVENAATQILIRVNNGSSPFTVALHPNGTLEGSGNADVAGRVVTGSSGDALTYAPTNARYTIGTLTPKTGS